MNVYSNGQTRYNNLMNSFNNPNMQEDDTAFKLGQTLGGIGMNTFGFLNKTDNDKTGEDTELSAGVGATPGLTMGIPDAFKTPNSANILGQDQLDELTKLATKANL